MESNFLNKASDFLGAEESRYFSKGFRAFSYDYQMINIEDKSLVGLVIVSIRNGDFDCCKATGHIGTIEYLAISSSICELILKLRYGLSSNEIANAWICGCKVKLNKSIDIDKQTIIPISCYVNDPYLENNSVNGHKSSFEIHIGESVVKMIVDHGLISSKHMDTTNQNNSGIDLYKDGYKFRTHLIENIRISLDKMCCFASIGIRDMSKQLSGIGANYKTTILTDIINVSGQLSQILLYKLENMERHQAGNLWLRELSINYPKPEESLDYFGWVEFTKFGTIKVNNEKWRSVNLTCHIGSVESNFKIAHKIN